MRKSHLFLSSLIIASCALGACTLKDVEDTVYGCGDNFKNCTLKDYWADGVCKDGDCIVTECAVGYHFLGEQCVPDSVDACGEEKTDCMADKSNPKVCSKGKCVLSCPDGEKNCDGACRNTANDSNNCGACGHGCDGDAVVNGDRKCTNSQCVLYCNEGFIESNGSCQGKFTPGNEPPAPSCPAYDENHASCVCSEKKCTIECKRGFTGENCNTCDGNNGYVSNGSGDCIQVGDVAPECSSDADCSGEVENGSWHCSSETQKCFLKCDLNYVIDTYGTGCELGVSVPEGCSSDEECNTDDPHGRGQCQQETRQCSVLCDEGYVNGSDGQCISDGNSDDECLGDSDCAIENGAGYCLLSKQCRYECNEGYEFDSSSEQFVCKLMNSRCNVPGDCNAKGNTFVLCNESAGLPGVCNYECKPGYIQNDSGECISIYDLCARDDHGTVEYKNGECIYTCESGYHSRSDNTGCEKDAPVPSCNPDDCESREGWKYADCSGDVCVALECEEDYHLYTNENVVDSTPICEIDSIEQCGSHDMNCTELAGWKTGGCNDGVCEAIRCQAGYLLNFDTKKCYNPCGGSNYYCATKEACCKKKEDCSNMNSNCFVIQPIE